MKRETKKFSGEEFGFVKMFRKKSTAQKHSEKFNHKWNFRIVKSKEGYALYAKSK